MNDTMFSRAQEHIVKETAALPVVVWQLHSGSHFLLMEVSGSMGPVLHQSLMDSC